MKNQRIVLVSRSRPSRTWKLADRIKREVPGAAICGIVQQPIERLTWAQKLITEGGAKHIGSRPGLWSQARVSLRSLLEELIHLALWLAHGCPRKSNVRHKFTVADLSSACRQAGYPLWIENGMAGPKVADAVQNADIIIAVDPTMPDAQSWAVPGRGLFQVVSASATWVAQRQCVELTVKHYSRESRAPYVIASLALPLQPYDGLLGRTLKTDLILDDLLIETTKTLVEGSPVEAAENVRVWAQRVVAPYLEQLQAIGQNTERAFLLKRYRRTWGLCLDTLLLISPVFIVRSWYRRLRGRYPVLILTHHLVADRPHRMCISTEAFWRQVAFLRRHYRIVTLAEAVAQLRSGAVRAPTVVLTFDDGYGDNFISLRAVAEETGIPVVLFLATQPIETHREFRHDLDYGIRGFLPLTWDQIRYWRERGAEYGSHTMTHADCGAADPQNLQEEVVESQQILEERLGVPVKFFAFPFGERQNISAPAMRMAESTYSYVLSGFGGENFPSKEASTPHLFRKSLYPSLWELELELQSVFDLVDHARRVVHRVLSRLIGSAPATASQALRHSGAGLTTVNRGQSKEFERKLLEETRYP
jgi:peptidoglycan/xylan/chitin deacetylase (PgdA/CDA1 family)